MKLFKKLQIIKAILYGKSYCYFTNGMVSYGKNKRNMYRIEVSLLFNTIQFYIYNSKKRPMFRNIYALTLLFLILSPILILAKIVYSIVYNYIDGGINFFKDGMWVDNVRYFNYTNFIGFILLLMYIIIW